MQCAATPLRQPAKLEAERRFHIDARRSPNQDRLQHGGTGGAQRSLSIPSALFRQTEVNFFE
jgi:hypothetical protein